MDLFAEAYAGAGALATRGQQGGSKLLNHRQMGHRQFATDD